MYCIITRDFFDNIMYLAWQDPVFLEDDGYFWTYKEAIDKILHNNSSEHPFLFNNQEEAETLLEKLKLPQKCETIRWDV